MNLKLVLYLISKYLRILISTSIEIIQGFCNYPNSWSFFSLMNHGYAFFFPSMSSNVTSISGLKRVFAFDAVICDFYKSAGSFFFQNKFGIKKTKKRSTVQPLTRNLDQFTERSSHVYLINYKSPQSRQVS